MPKTIEEFAGPWHLSKQIADRRGRDARFSGTARIECHDGGWVYSETGTLSFGAGAELSAERRYLWYPTTQGVDIAFDDGRAFHHLPFDGGGDRHHCAPDTYDVAYDFGGWPLHWQAVWEVAGPRKDYRMTCRYRR